MMRWIRIDTTEKECRALARTGSSFPYVCGLVTLSGALSMLPACGPSSSTASDAGSPTDSGTKDSSSKDSGKKDAATSLLGFQPSNITMTSIMAQVAMAQDEDLSSCDGIQTIESNLGSCTMSPITSTTEPFGTGQTTDVALIVVKSLKLEANTIMQIQGTLPIVIVSLGDVTLDSGSSIQANSVSDTDNIGPGGAAPPPNANQKGLGPGGGTAGNTTLFIAGGGGSFCGLGGAGGGATAAATPVYGNSDVRPLQGGSSGGNADETNAASGPGGGAIQIVAMGTITLNSTAYITSGGEGGSGCIGSACSGGGSGGAILLEANTVNIAGILAANGGGGGNGFTSGGDALPLSSGQAPTAALGGATDDGGAAAGGNGSAGATTTGGAGVVGTISNANPLGYAPAGGGGGAGWIRINSSTGKATLTGGTLSPDVTTTCATQGTLRTLAEGP